MQSPRLSNIPRATSGCWTCRLRRKKCDAKSPVCGTCTALHITCHHDQDKPVWMDGSIRQEAMAEQIKREVKNNAHLRRRTFNVPSDRHLKARDPTSESSGLNATLSREISSERCNIMPKTLVINSDGMKPCVEEATVRNQSGANCMYGSKEGPGSLAFGRSDTVLVMFYLDNLFPFLFPFYQPSFIQGGRAWILEMIMNSPVVRRVCLCQGSYFFSLARGTANWEAVLVQTRDAFEVLRQALQVISGSSNITEHLHGAVRIMTSIIQVQRFEVCVSCFDNCQPHLSAALALFEQLLDSSNDDTMDPIECNSSFNAVLWRLGPTPCISSDFDVPVTSAEQAAFRFSSTLLVLDDIIASTVLQEEPRLYKYHHSLLGGIDDSEPTLDLEATIGCQNWAMLQIGEIAALDAWKHRCKKVGNLDVMELVHRAMAIKSTVEAHLTRLETGPTVIKKEATSLLNVFSASYDEQFETSVSQSSLTTRVWAHAALIYLFVVVSGWQPTSVEVRHHVDRIVELLTGQVLPTALIRTVVWPFCVAGCLAEPGQEAQFRGMVESLKPVSVFGTVHKALEIMEGAWRNRDADDAATCDLAMCFRSRGSLVLLV